VDRALQQYALLKVRWQGPKSCLSACINNVLRSELSDGITIWHITGFMAGDFTHSGEQLSRRISTQQRPVADDKPLPLNWKSTETLLSDCIHKIA